MVLLKLQKILELQKFWKDPLNFYLIFYSKCKYVLDKQKQLAVISFLNDQCHVLLIYKKKYLQNKKQINYKNYKTYFVRKSFCQRSSLKILYLQILE